MAVLLAFPTPCKAEAVPPETAWIAAQDEILAVQSAGEAPYVHLAPGYPAGGSTEDAARRMEEALRQAAAGGVAQAQLAYGLLLAGTPRLASRNLPVALAPLDRISPQFDVYGQPPPLDVSEALRLLHQVADRGDVPVPDRMAARYGLAEMNAAMGPDLGDGTGDLAARIDALLAPEPTGLAAAAVLVAAGRCDAAVPRLDRAARETGAADPAIAFLRTGCGDPKPATPQACLDPEQPVEPVGIMPAIQPLSPADAGPVRIRTGLLSDIVACLWLNVARRSDDAAPPLPAAVRQARDAAAVTAIGWPTNGDQRAFMTGIGRSLRQSDPEEAVRLLARGTAEGRLEAAQMRLGGDGVRPDARVARDILRSAAALPGAIPATEVLLARLEYRGTGGPADPLAAVRRLMRAPGPEAREALDAIYESLPWKLVPLDESGWTP